MSILRRSRHILYVLFEGNKNTFETILQEPKFLKLALRALKEICHNFLYIHLDLPKTEKRKLRKIRDFLFDLDKGAISTTSARKNRQEFLLKNQKNIKALLAVFFKTFTNGSV